MLLCKFCISWIILFVCLFVFYRCSSHLKNWSRCNPVGLTVASVRNASNASFVLGPSTVLVSFLSRSPSAQQGFFDFELLKHLSTQYCFPHLIQFRCRWIQNYQFAHLLEFCDYCLEGYESTYDLITYPKSRCFV